MIFFLSLITLYLTNSCNFFSSKKLDIIPFEMSNGIETATYNQTLEFCEKISKLSPKIKYQSIGKSSQGYKIPMLIIDNDRYFTLKKVRKSGKVVLLIQANVHAGETDGNDAGMLLLKDMVLNNSFPKNITILFLPVVNPDGLNRFSAHNRINQNGPAKMGWRTNAQNLNLNRDFVKTETPEIQAWLKLFNSWKPDFTIDVHVTDGADYQYVLTYIVETMGNMNEIQTQWLEKYIEDTRKKVHNQGIPTFPYTSFKKWHDPRSGLYLRPTPPMLSTGYIALQNRPSILIEAHSLKPFKQRVEAVLSFIRESISFLETEAQTLVEINQKSDILSTKLFENHSLIPLDFTLTEKCDTVDFLGVEYDVIKSDLTGGDWFQYHTDKPITYQLPMFQTVTPTVEVTLPAAYIVGSEWSFIKRKLDFHGIKYVNLQSDSEIEANTYMMSNPKWSPVSIESRLMLTSVELSKSVKKHSLTKGTFIIPTNQPSSKIIAAIFDPNSSVSFLKYGFFNSVFEQTEYFETYKMEIIAREMLDSIPDLFQNFENWRNEQPQTPSHYEQLGWFWRQTPYFDYKKNVYPVLEVDEKNIQLLNEK